MHVAEGTARADRGTDVVMEIPKKFAKQPDLIDWDKFDKDKSFTMMRDWEIAATGAAKIDEILLSMMADQLELYAYCKTNGDLRGMGQIIDRFHRLATEFGMTPRTRDELIKKSQKEEEDSMQTIMEGP